VSLCQVGVQAWRREDGGESVPFHSLLPVLLAPAGPEDGEQPVPGVCVHELSRSGRRSSLTATRRGTPEEHGDEQLAVICGLIAADEKRHERAY